MSRAIVLLALALILASCSASKSGAPASSTSTTRATTTTPANVLDAPTRVVQTAMGSVGYREVGSGNPLLLITGVGASMDNWPPSFIDALAGDHEVVVFDNSGVGETTAVATPTISAMADQTSSFIDALHLNRPAVLGWSMGGMIAQALAVEHPTQVSRLILAATQAGTGKSLPVPAGPAAAVAGSNPAEVLAVIFPADQQMAAKAYLQGILQYTGFYEATTATKANQTIAIQQWIAGQDPTGREISSIRVPTLVADGTLDELDPTSNDRLLANSISGAKLNLYPGAGHAFLFQDAASFVPAVLQFFN